jgi:hypothetical protein
MALAEFAILIFILSLLLMMVLLIMGSAGNTNRYMNFPHGARGPATVIMAVA